MKVILLLHLFVCSFCFQFSSISSKWTRMRAASTVRQHAAPANLMPISDNVLVRVKEKTKKSTGGIIFADAAQEAPLEGTIVAVGPGKADIDSGYFHATSVLAGESVAYGKYNGVEVKLNGTLHQIIKEDDILFKYHSTSSNGEEGSVSLKDIQCLSDKILVKVSVEDEVSSGGIFVSSGKNKRSDSGEVVKVGPGRRSSNGQVLLAMPVEVGNNVKYREFAASEIKLEGSRYAIIRSTDVVAKW